MANLPRSRRTTPHLSKSRPRSLWPIFRISRLRPLIGPAIFRCPLCNKLSSYSLGAAGALTYFNPIQPVPGLLSVAILG